MSLDRSFKTFGTLVRHRNVLTRAERIARLMARGKFDPKAGEPLGLPKVAHRKVEAAHKAAKKKEEEAASEASTETAAPAPTEG